MCSIIRYVVVRQMFSSSSCRSHLCIRLSYLFERVLVKEREKKKSKIFGNDAREGKDA